MINEINEIKEAEAEKLILDRKNDIYKNNLAEQLVNGLGEKMFEQIKNPIIPTKFQIFKNKFKKLINDLLEVL